MKIMKLKIKILKGDECEIEVNEQATVRDVKQEVRIKLGIPAEQQRLMSKGKALADTSVLTDCGITNDSKLFISMKPGTVVEATGACSTEVHLDFWKELHNFYNTYFTEEQSQQLMESFKLEFDHMTRTLSLDDIERIAAAYIGKSG